MSGNRNANNYFFHFILFVILNTSFGILVYLILNIFGFEAPNKSKPLGASDSFILYNTFMKGMIVVVVLHFYRRWNVLSGSSRLIRIIAFGIVVYLVNGIIQTGLAMLSSENTSMMNILWSFPGAMLFRVLTVFAAMILYVWIMKEESREDQELKRKLEIASLQQLKTKAELEGLHAKVNPHFLYNALNSIHTLIDQQPDKAKDMIHLLSKLFRLSISNDNEQCYPLREELELVKTYLAIEQVRFGDNLHVEIDCPDHLTSESVPRFILQPLVENAIKHGTSRLATQGHIMILIRKPGDYLEMQVRDNGPAFAEDMHSGIGINLVREKVRALGDDGSSFEIVSTGMDVPPIAGPWKYVGLKFKRK